MRITHYLPDLSAQGGGLQNAVVNLCNMMASAGHDVRLATVRRRAEGLADSVRMEMAPPTSAGFRPWARIPAFLEGSDVLHLHGVWPPSNPPQVSRSANDIGVPFVVTLHGMLSEWAMSRSAWKKRPYLTLFGNGILRAAAAIHATTASELERARPFLRDCEAGKQHVAALPADLSDFARPTDTAVALRFVGLPARPAHVILFLGRLDSVKRADLVLLATRQLIDAGIDCDVIIAGDGERRVGSYLKQLAAESGIAGRAWFPGAVGPGERAALYQMADVFVLPSSSENFGYTLIESLASGTPVVTTRGVGLSRDLDAAGTGLIADQDADSLARAIRHLLTDKSAAASTADRGRNWALRRFDPDTLAPEYEALYAAAIAGRLSPSRGS